MTEPAPEREMVAPAFLSVPPRVRSMAQQIARLCEAMGEQLDPEQELAVDTVTGVKADGTPAVLEAALIAARQNLKTYCLERIVLAKLCEPLGERERRMIVWSAHMFDTAQETFRNFDELFASHGFLSRRVKKIHRGNGEEEIELHGRRRLKFKARSKTGGRGLTGDTVVLDEAFALQPGHMGALLPTLSTKRRAQVLYGSSAGLMESVTLRGVRDRGRTGDGSIAYVEWCAPGSLAGPGCAEERCDHKPGTRGCTLDREELWPLANPALGHRITLDYLRSERNALPPEEFARERLGWWDAPEEESGPITVGHLLAAVDPESSATGRRKLAVDVAPDRRSASISGAGRRADGLAHAAVARTGPGADWIVDAAVEIATRHEISTVVVDGMSPAAAYVPALREKLEPLGVEVVVYGARDMAEACGLLQDALTASPARLRHRGDEILTTALKGARRRDIGDGGWGWARKRSDLDITSLVSFTLAHHALVTEPKSDPLDNIW